MKTQHWELMESEPQTPPPRAARRGGDPHQTAVHRLPVRHRQAGFRVPIRARPGFTRIEMLVMVLTVGLLVGLTLPALYRPHTKSRRIYCVNNLKQAGLGFRVFAADHADQYPMQVETNVLGTPAFSGAGELFRYYLCLSNDLASPAVLICPADTRQPARNFPSLTDSNLSYFLGLGAREIYPGMLLSGDRNLEVDGRAVGPGLLRLNGRSAVGWTEAMHNRSGNVVLADGSVQQMSHSRWRDLLGKTQDPGVELLVP